MTAPALVSNRLIDLAERSGELFRHGRARTAEAAAAYLECGRLLAEAKAECGHGQWLPFLARARIPERTARRMMRLHRSGTDPDTLAEHGVQAALASIARPSKSVTVTDLPDPEPPETPAPDAAPVIEPEPWRGMSADDALRWLAHAAVPPLPAFGARAYALRKRGLKWIEIAHVLAYRPDFAPPDLRRRAILQAARSHARLHSLPWPVPRSDAGEDG